MAQRLALQVHRGGASPPSDQPIPMPIHVNPGVGEGPLGDEDAENFHP